MWSFKYSLFNREIWRRRRKKKLFQNPTPSIMSQSQSWSSFHALRLQYQHHITRDRVTTTTKKDGENPYMPRVKCEMMRVSGVTSSLL